MEALVLAGGTGSRLRPLTDATPKQLLPIANKPVLEHVIENIANTKIQEIGVILGNKGQEKIKGQLGDGREYGVDITYIVQGDPNGLADAVACGEAFVDGDPFLVFFGDTIIDQKITNQLVRQFDPGVHTVAVGFQEVSNPERFGIADIQGDRLIGVREKPTNPPSQLAYVGAVVLSPLAFDVIRSQTPSDRGELELTETIDALVKADGETYWDVLPGVWQDVGTPKDVIETNALVVQKQEQLLPDTIDTDQLSCATSKIRIGQDCSIDEEAIIVGPVVIGDHVDVSGASIVGPNTSIGDGSSVSGTEISSSVVLPDVDLSRATVSDSVIGSGAKIRNTGSSEQPSRMVVSRESVVEGKRSFPSVSDSATDTNGNIP